MDNMKLLINPNQKTGTGISNFLVKEKENQLTISFWFEDTRNGKDEGWKFHCFSSFEALEEWIKQDNIEDFKWFFDSLQGMASRKSARNCKEEE